MAESWCKAALRPSKVLDRRCSHVASYGLDRTEIVRRTKTHTNAHNEPNDAQVLAQSGRSQDERQRTEGHCTTTTTTTTTTKITDRIFKVSALDLAVSRFLTGSIYLITAIIGNAIKMLRSHAVFLIATTLLSLASAQLFPVIPVPPQQQQQQHHQAPMSSSSGSVIISDVIGRERTINLFAGFCRDIDTVSARLDSAHQNTTVLAPLNSDITRLPRKPWEDPKDYAELGETAYEGQAGEDRAHRNLRRFVENHVVPESPWDEGQKTQTLGGSTVWWETKDGKKLVSPAERGSVSLERAC